MDEFLICPVCKITKANGVFYFSHNNTPTTPENVAGLVCKHILNNSEKCKQCINHKKNDETGDSFEKRTHGMNLTYGTDRSI